jgi:hypothetical protein
MSNEKLKNPNGLPKGDAGKESQAAAFPAPVFAGADVSIRNLIARANEVANRLKRKDEPANACSAATLQAYKKIAIAVAKGGFGAFEKFAAKSTYNKACAAIRAYGPGLLSNLADTALKRLNSKQPVPKEFIGAMENLVDILNAVNGYAFGEDRTLLTARELKPRKSKLKVLRELPVDWAHLVLDYAQTMMPKNVVLHLTIAMAMNSGARPAELARGILISRYGVELKLTIAGGVKARAAGDRGLGERWIRFSVDTPSRKLLDAALGDKDKVMLQGMKALDFCHAMIRIGRQLFPELKETVSPYAFRHRFASEMKAAGASWADIATALGHSTDKCSKTYGRARGKTDGSMNPTAVGAAKEPAAKRKPAGPTQSMGISMDGPGMGD